MTAAPHALILRAPGTNCDAEADFALRQVGATTHRVHVQELRRAPSLLKRVQILVLPGGFSYGDDVGAGRILANELEHFLRDALLEFRSQEKLILGICNGFQVLLKAGLLVPADEDGPLATLTANAHARFEDRWVHLAATPHKCVFLKGLSRLYLPVAHGEGNFRCRKEWIREGLDQAGQVVLRYTDPAGEVGGFPYNPNGSQGEIAGVCDVSGRVLGLMPHPERHVLPTHHPRWTRAKELPKEGDGLALFRNAVEYFA